MKKRFIFIITLFSLFYCCLISTGCDENIVNISKQCTEEPLLQYLSFNLSVITDDTCIVPVTVDTRGLIFAENITIKRNGISKSANIGGYICKDTRFYIDVIYNDTANTSRLKLEGGPIVSNTFSGKIFYCANENNICNFVQIGVFSGGHTGSNNRYGGVGGFNTPLFMGIFYYGYSQSPDHLLKGHEK